MVAADGAIDGAAGGPSSDAGTVTQIASGGWYSCALLMGGRVRCWGDGGAALGYGDKNSIGDHETPASVGDVALGAPAAQIAAGDSQTCALLEGGAVRCWG